MRIQNVPAENFSEYRLNVMFDGYKWDWQSGEQATISDKVLLLEPHEADTIINHAVCLYHETTEMERALHKNPELVAELGISEQMTDALCGCRYNPQNHIRFMRFDFHFTTDGWLVSEVNSDVPAGYPEASVLPVIAQKYFDGCRPHGSFGEVIRKRLEKLIPEGSTIAYLHDTHTVEDYQIMRFLGDLMEKSGYKSVYASPEHIKWENGRAVGIGGIVRYYPIEYIEFLSADWVGFLNSETPSCNHPIALLTQSKRLPLVWDRIDVPVPTWKKLLPETRCVRDLIARSGWIFKPAFGRVGEGINIPGTVSSAEEKEIFAAANAEPKQWVAQKMFSSVPVDNMHINIGVFVTDGEFAGFYARVSSVPKIDEGASEIPILIEEISGGLV